MSCYCDQPPAVTVIPNILYRMFVRKSRALANLGKDCGDEGLYGYTDEAREKELSITVAARGTIGYTAME